MHQPCLRGISVSEREPQGIIFICEFAVFLQDLRNQWPLRLGAGACATTSASGLMILHPFVGPSMDQKRDVVIGVGKARVVLLQKSNIDVG